MKSKRLFFLVIFSWCGYTGQLAAAAYFQGSPTDSLFVESQADNGQDSVKKNSGIPTLEDFIKKGKSYSILANQIKLEIGKPLDTLELTAHIRSINGFLEEIETRTKQPGQNFNLRYINALSWFIDDIRHQNEDFEEIVDKKMNELMRLDSTLQTIKEDKFLTYELKESNLIPTYTESIINLRNNLFYLDSSIYQQELRTAKFQSELSKISINLTVIEQFIDSSKKELERSLLKKEINYIWDANPLSSPKTILEITKESFMLNSRLLARYFASQSPQLVFSLLLILSVYWVMKKVIQKIESQKEFGKLILDRVTYFAKYPLASTMISILPLVVFIFERPSLTFFTFILVVQIIFTTKLIIKNYHKRAVVQWMVMVVIFLFFAASNLYWEIVYQERIYILFGSIIPLYIAGVSSRKFKSSNEKDTRFLKLASSFMFVLISVGIVANIFGRFSLAKIIGVSAVTGFVQAISLYFFIMVIMEGIYLLLENSKKDADSFTSYFDFQGIQNRLRGTFLLLAFVLWGYSFLQNTSLFTAVIELITGFLSKERFLGSNSFTFGSVILFGVVMYASLKIANTVAYFATIKDQQSTTRNKRLGSSILILRLVLITLGFFIAAAAANIPLTNVTIVLGALSVGIGFGLQTIINNLVSGVILAFERPIQIGDEIEVGTRSGTVKDVGIRASKIQAYDGSEIVVPNGDLLSQSLVNWTLSDKKRRIELIIGVGYDSDMKKVKSILEGILDRERILKTPKPRVFMQTFGDNSVDFRLLFWVASIDIWVEMRSEVMFSIFDAFKAEDIEIPYPKRDLFLKAMPESKQTTTATGETTPAEGTDEHKKSPGN